MEAAIRSFSAGARILQARGSSCTLAEMEHWAHSPALIYYLGEIHEQTDVIRFQIATLSAILHRKPPAIHVVLEHFTQNECRALESALTDSTGQLQGESAEGFRGIFTVLQYLRDNSNGATVRPYAGFPTREQARRFARPDDVKVAYAEAAAAGWLPAGREDLLVGSEAHYSFFEALLTGKPETDGADWGNTTGSARRIFPAQTVKDLVMAFKITKAWKDLPLASGCNKTDDSTDDKDGDGGYSAANRREGCVVAIGGCGHFDFGFGVPERVAALLGIPPHVPGQRSNPEQWIASVRPRGPGSLQCMPTIAFNGVGPRVPADMMYEYVHEDGDEGE